MLALFLGFRSAREQNRSTYPTIALADGTVLRIEGLTWGSNQVVRLRPKWISWIYSQLSLSVRRQLPLLEPDRSLGWGAPEPHLWFSRWNPESKSYLSIDNIAVFEIDESGREYPYYPGGRLGTGRASYTQPLPVVGWRAPQLRYRIVIGDRTNDVVMDNPRKDEVFPNWEAKPLPQSLSTNGTEFILEKIEFQSLYEPMWRPKITASRPGQDVSAWFIWHNVWTDPTGNRNHSRLPANEPVWQAEVSAYPSAQFPFPEGHGVSLGRHIVPDPGAALSIPLDSTLANAGVQSAWLTGAGHFTFRNGSNVFASLPASQQQHRVSSGPGYWEESFSRTTPHLHLWLEGPATGTRLLAESHREDLWVLVRGRRIDGSSQGDFGGGGQTSSGSRLSRIMGIGLIEAKSGETLDLDLHLVEPWPMSFIFPAPRPPPP